jgi:short subunit dehydrogenase-like uncharacterized protein
LFLLDNAKKQGLDVTQVQGYLQMKGGASGGTIQSVFSFLELPRSEQRATARPFYLNPPSKQRKATGEEADQKLPRYSSEMRKWTTPFPLCLGDIRVVRRSASLLNWGDDFHYNESYAHSSVFHALIFYISFLMFAMLLLVPFTRKFIRRLLPQPGQGPSEHVMKTGFFRVTHYGTTPDGKTISTSVQGGEPGYTETSRMLSEAALCLAFDQNELKNRVGVLTPAAGLGNSLIQRLQAIGIQFSVKQ